MHINIWLLLTWIRVWRKTYAEERAWAEFVDHGGEG